MGARTCAGVSLLLLLSLPLNGAAWDPETTGLDGHWWLRQSAATRQGFVQGWTDGNMSGWLSAQARLIAVAAEAREVGPPASELAAALLTSLDVLREVTPDYREPAARYADLVTTFFKAYPDLRGRPVSLVLKGLDGRGSLTLEDIARWLRMTDLR